MAPVITIYIRPRGPPIQTLPREIRIACNASTEQLYHSLAKTSAFSLNRLRLTTGTNHSLIPNSKKLTLDEARLTDMSTVHAKDLGPQISWRTVFFAEYLGPVFIPALTLFHLRPSPSTPQLLLCALLTTHFIKREYETLFIHRFSNATMPARNLLKNTLYYWLMVANIAYWQLRPGSDVSPPLSLLYPGLALFLFGEVANLNTHRVLRDLRPTGTGERGIPAGFGFGAVTCPNYGFEILAWVGMYLVSGGSWSILLPTVVGGVQMAIWARKKEWRYREEFGRRYRGKRFVMIPGVV
ncbi:3-oxo-5a-steroid 4- dehydrogenase [Aspergillus nanangensis]|uniref:3-oxo-5a-steroid 4- dehydrogenase n=1 Tax=Aspergillus nanangensis TaxID=2582783 RepID=A0AAD4CQE7_ASPNN|nr:3-oxo-5a-steroid 4- dehydrogenase [Aspergillus nanangensis]